MTHLTVAQILQAADGSADYATQATVTNHLAVCPRCRAEVEFQRSLLRTARRMPVASVPDRFTKSVMARVTPRKQHPAAAWILNNMGSMFAMMAVLGTLWYVLANPGAVVPSSGSTQLDGVTQQWQKGLEDGYAQLSEAVRSLSSRRGQSVNAPVPDRMMQKLSLIIVSLGMLALIDRFWSKKLKPKPRVRG